MQWPRPPVDPEFEPWLEPWPPYEPAAKPEEEGAARGSRWAAALPLFIVGFAAFAVGALATKATHAPGESYLVFIGPMALGAVSILLGVILLTVVPDDISWPIERRYLTVYREVVETLLLALLIFLAVSETLQNFKVEGSSMLPSLENHQYIIVNKLAYAQFDLGIFDFLPFFDAGDDSTHHLFGGPERGDVVVFESPKRPGQDLIKRVMGVPGDKVEIRDGVVYINDEPIDESYTQGATGCPCGPWYVEEDHYFVLGDHRSNSSDSRSIGQIPEKNIIGKTWLSYWPLSDIGLAPNHSVSFANEDSED